MTTIYLAPAEIAEMIGVTPGTLHSYITKGMLPEPDAEIGKGRGRTRGWLPETIEAWQATRPGSGNWGSHS